MAKKFPSSVTPDRVSAIAALYHADTAAEKVAIEYAERFCTDSARIDDDLMSRLQEHFDEGAVVELTLVIAKYLAFGRFMQVLGLDQTCTLQRDDSGAVVTAS